MRVLSAFLLIVLLANAYTKPIEEHQQPRPYKFDYGVSDHHTGDHHNQHEINDGHIVKGSYSLKEADGTIRVVEYLAGPHSGFNAVVKRIGHAQHPQHYEYHGKHGEQESYKGGYGSAESHIGTTHWGYNY